MNSLSFIHVGNSANVMVRRVLVTGWEMDKASMSSSTRRDCAACRRGRVDMRICEALTLRVVTCLVTAES